MNVPVERKEVLEWKVIKVAATSTAESVDTLKEEIRN